MSKEEEEGLSEIQVILLYLRSNLSTYSTKDGFLVAIHEMKTDKMAEWIFEYASQFKAKEVSDLEIDDNWPEDTYEYSSWIAGAKWMRSKLTRPD